MHRQDFSVVLRRVRSCRRIIIIKASATETWVTTHTVRSTALHDHSSYLCSYYGSLIVTCKQIHTPSVIMLCSALLCSTLVYIFTTKYWPISQILSLAHSIVEFATKCDYISSVSLHHLAKYQHLKFTPTKHGNGKNKQSSNRMCRGSVASHSRCGGFFNACFTAYFLLNMPVKKILLNPWISDKDIDRSMMSHFLTHSAHTHTHV